MNDCPDSPWKQLVRHDLSGREVYHRVTNFKRFGNNEGSMNLEFELRDADGQVQATSSVKAEWDEINLMRPTFNEAGTEVRFLTSFNWGRHATLTMPSRTSGSDGSN